VFLRPAPALAENVRISPPFASIDASGAAMSRAVLVTCTLLAAVLLEACATTPPPPPAKADAAPAEADEAPAGPQYERLSTAPPPARRRRQYVVDEKEYLRLRHAYPRGFQPEDCVAFCKQATAYTPSDDGEWIWTLRCLLDRTVRDEGAIACREEAKPARAKTAEEPAPATQYRIED